jgi:hypothetical protein
MSQEEAEARAQETEARRRALEERRQNLAVVELGIEAQTFIGSNLGRYVLARAEAEREEALAKLIEQDPSDVNAVRRLQSDIRVIDRAQQYLADAISEGEAMGQHLIEEEAQGGGP